MEVMTFVSLGGYTNKTVRNVTKLVDCETNLIQYDTVCQMSRTIKESPQQTYGE